MGKTNQPNKISYPEKLPDDQFYGMILDKDQIKLKDAIWSDDTILVIVDAKAGTGKTTVAVGVANLLVHYGRYDGIVYIASPVNEIKQGYLPGSLEEKSAPYFDPIYEALLKCNVNLNTALSSKIENNKYGTAYVDTITHTYLRGTNFENKVVIIDESQNYYADELKKVLTRIHDNCKVILIGHTGQVDIYKNKDRSGFKYYLDYYNNPKFSNDPRVAICELHTNHRGWLSTTADDLYIPYEHNTND